MPETATARILVVDDEAEHLKALCDTLGAQGYETVGCADPHEALAKVREAGFDLILADLMMPEMDGIALFQAAVALDPDLAGVIMTGAGTIATAVEAMKAGALDYILKPFKLSVLLPVLSRALGVRRLKLENAALQRRLRDRTAELEEANEDLEAFARSVSHDLRAPLRAINGFSQTLSERLGPQIQGETRQLFDRITANTVRMNRLIEDLLRLSRLGRQKLSKRPVDMALLVGEVLEELRPEHEGQVDLKLGVMPGCVGDAGLLKQVWANLLSNAFKFTRKKDRPVVEIGLMEMGEPVYFVRDNGAGFEMKHVHKLFGVFQRFHGADEFEGTGIGLSIAHRIIHRHGGRIWAEGKPDAGATFYFTVTRARVGA